MGLYKVTKSAHHKLVLQAIGAGSKAIAETCKALESLQAQVGKVKRQAIPPVGQELQSLIEVCNCCSDHSNSPKLRT